MNPGKQIDLLSISKSLHNLFKLGPSGPSPRIISLQLICSLTILKAFISKL